MSAPHFGGGGHVARIAAFWDMPLSGPMGVALALIYPCGKARNSPPDGALTERVRYPFPSRRMIPDRSSPSRVRFAASRPGPLRADLRGAPLFTRGKGGTSTQGSSTKPPRPTVESVYVE